MSRPTPAQGLGGALALALHAAALAALLSYEPARSAMLTAAPVVVSLISTPPAEPKPAPPPEVPKPRPLALPRPPDAQPLAAATTPAPAVMAAPPPPPEPPAPAMPEAQAPPPPAAVSTPPEPLTPPIFDADYLDNLPPPYPATARRSGQQGRVLLRVRVSAAGAAEEVLVRESSGHARLDEAARDTVRRWRFVPARRGAQPVPAWVLIPISFRLEG